MDSSFDEVTRNRSIKEYKDACTNYRMHVAVTTTASHEEMAMDLLVATKSSDEEELRSPLLVAVMTLFATGSAFAVAVVVLVVSDAVCWFRRSVCAGCLLRKQAPNRNDRRNQETE